MVVFDLWAERFSLIFYTSASKEKQLRPADLYEKFKLALLRMVNDEELKKKRRVRGPAANSIHTGIININKKNHKLN